jgi:putative ABC transport system permease protein
VGIIVKFILKNAWEKKVRTFLIIFSIMISSALIFSSNALTDSITKMHVERMRQYFGNADIIIHAGGNANGTISPGKAYSLGAHIEYVVGSFAASGQYKNISGEKDDISLKGLSLEQTDILNPIQLEQEYDLRPFTGRKIIVSRQLAAKYHWTLGDTLELGINNTRQNFILSGIAYPTGFFLDDGRTSFALMPQETLSSIYGVRGRWNQLFIKFSNPVEKGLLQEKLQKLYKNCGFSYYSYSASGMSTPFQLMTFLVCFMSIFIIYTTFKVITMERLPVIGTFRSIGATKKTTDFILLMESLVYGIIGGLIGSGLGIGVLYIMSDLTKWNKAVPTTIVFTPLQLAAAFICAPLLCLGSSLVPILKVSRIPVKDVILNTMEKPRKKTRWKLVLAVVMLAISVSVPHYIPNGLALPVDMTCLLMLSAATVLLAPYLTHGLVFILQRMYPLLFGNEGILAAKNLKDNKSVLNSISLLSIGIATLLLIGMVNNSMSQEVLDVYKNNILYDISMWVPNADKNTRMLIQSVDGVEDVYCTFTRGVQAVGSNEWIRQIDGVDAQKHPEYIKLDLDGEWTDVFNKLDAGRNIYLSHALNYTLGLKTGDTLTLQMPVGNRDYKVSGFFDTVLNNGQYALISERYFRMDMQARFYSDIFIKTSKDPQAVADSLRQLFARKDPWIETVLQSQKRELENNSQIFGILIGFSVLTMLIGIIGIFNNLIIGFIERRHSFAVLRSIGMSRRQIVKMIFVEALSGGLIGGIAGIITGTLQVFIVPYITRATGQFFSIHYNPGFLYLFLLFGMAITLIASISPAMRTSRMNIIEAVKYE